MTSKNIQQTYELKGVEKMRRQWGGPAIKTALLAAAKEVGAHTAGEVASVTPVNKNPAPGQTRGRLAAGWSSKARKTRGGAEAIIGNNVFYGPYVNFGTGIYAGKGRIRAKRGKFLVFNMGGQTIFARSIKGQRGQHFAESGMKNASGDIPNIAVDAIEHSLGRKT